MSRKPVALLLNDIHVSSDTLKEFDLNWKEAVSIAKDKKIEHIVIGGDLFTSRASQTLDVLLSVQSAFLLAEEHGILINIIEGNHDKVNQEHQKGYCSVFDQFNNVNVVKTFEIIELENVRLGAISYFPENTTFPTYLHKLEKEMSKKDYDSWFLYIHQGIRGVLAKPSDDELPSDLFTKWDKVFVGHYHNRSEVGKNIEYIGSSRQHNFGEDEEKGYTILYSDYSYEFIKNQANKRYVTIDCQFEDIGHEAFANKIDSYTDQNYKVRLKILCSEEQTASINKQILFDLGASKIEIVQTNTKKISTQEALSERFDKNGIIDSYKQYCEQNNIKNVDFGITYLKKIKQ